MKRKKRKKTRIGVRLATALLLLACLVASAEKPDKSKAPEPVSFIAGTVYRTPGFSTPGAEVTLIPAEKKSGSSKFRKQTTLTDARGEFIFRVPPVPMKYTVTVQLKGFVSQTKSVEIEHQQHRELPFTLEPEAKSQ